MQKEHWPSQGPGPELTPVWLNDVEKVISSSVPFFLNQITRIRTYFFFSVSQAF